MGRHQGTRPRLARGFTLVELMIVVAIVAILAMVVVPSFLKEGRKVKSSAEVTPMIAELSTKLEQFKIETGTYGDDRAACPASPIGPSATPANAQSECIDAGNPWEGLRIAPPEQTVRCSYAIFTDQGSATAAPTGFTWTEPAGSWYFIHAICDGDGVSGTNAEYFMASNATTVQKRNEGR